MQQNLQQHEQFITELGSLLVTQLNQRHSLSQRQAAANLATYVRAARHHHKMSRAALAHKVGKMEVDIFALEQGLYPDAHLDLAFLCRLASALGEEVETLMLLLGRPTSSSPLTEASGGRRSTGSHMNHCRTASQQPDNRQLIGLWANQLYKSCLNLMDSVQEGRLFFDVRTICHREVVGFWRLSATVGVLAGLLLFWVSTYSLSDFFDAQSGTQFYMTFSSIDHSQSGIPASGAERVRASVVDIRQPNTSFDLASSSTKETSDSAPDRDVGQPAQVALEPADHGSVTTTSFLVLPMPDEAQQCDTRIRSKFALCPV